MSGRWPYKDVGKEVVVKISGQYEDWGEKIDLGEKDKSRCVGLLQVNSFGTVQFSYRDDFGAFANCRDLKALPKKEIPDASVLLDLSYGFYQFNRSKLAIEGWDVSQVENMGEMFRDAKKFNQSLVGWQMNASV